jgi:uncharacterized protein
LKFFIFLLAILFGVWLWRKNRLHALKEKQQDQAHKAASEDSGSGTGTTKTSENPQQPSPMHACDHCGVHLPESDMVFGRSGRYCSEPHRKAAGDSAS